MGFNIVRLTLYGLLSAVENDFRKLIQEELCNSHDIQTLVSEATLHTLRARAGKDGASSNCELIGYLDFADAVGILNSHKAKLDPILQKALRNHSAALEKLGPIRNRVMHSRPLQFEDFSFVVDTTKKLTASSERHFPSLADFVTELANDPNYVFNLQPPKVGESVDHTHNLPIPDFDETGFLGREAELRALSAAIRGPYPIITIVGEGGVGKSALALRTAYEILDDKSFKFDAIVWTSSKTTRLSVGDIEDIEGAIATSLGIFRDISKTLAGSSANGSMDEVLEYLNTFKILLVVDNLETVLDAKIRQFLAGLTGASKILITSRVGVGELDFRFRLSPMASPEAVQLLRATAQVRRVPQLAKLSSIELKAYCDRMKNNPAFIKWFVAAVQCGRRPEEVLANPLIFLDFCLSNVYDFIGDFARNIADAFVSVPGRHSQAALSYLTDLEGDDFQTGLQELITTNMVVMHTERVGSGFESIYEMDALPRLYLLRKHPPRESTVAHLNQRKKEIARLYQKLHENLQDTLYKPDAVVPRFRDDAVVGSILLDALSQLRKGLLDQAVETIEKAKRLSPGYFEVYRVEAWALSHLGNVPGATEAYESAIQLEPKSAQLRYWYGSHLLRSGSGDLAVSELEIACRLDPHAPHIRAELGRALNFLGKWREAETQLLLAFDDPSFKTKTVATDILIQIYLREATKQFDARAFTTAFEICSALVEHCKKLTTHLIDQKILSSIGVAKSLLTSLRREFSKEDTLSAIDEAVRLLEQLGSQPPVLISETDREAVGVIHKLRIEKGFGFLLTEKQEELFFHKSALPSPADFKSLKIGERVFYQVHLHDGRTVAAPIRLIDTARSDVENSPQKKRQRRQGIVSSFDRARCTGLIQGSDGTKAHFNRKGLDWAINSDRITNGLPITYILDETDISIALSIRIDAAHPNILTKLVSEGDLVTAPLMVKGDGSTFGFADLGDGVHILVRQPEFLEPLRWEQISVGALLSFRIDRAENGIQAKEISVLASE